MHTEGLLWKPSVETILQYISTFTGVRSLSYEVQGQVQSAGGCPSSRPSTPVTWDSDPPPPPTSTPGSSRSWTTRLSHLQDHHHHLRNVVRKKGIMWGKFPSGGPPRLPSFPQFWNFHIFLPFLLPFYKPLNWKKTEKNMEWV